MRAISSEMRVTPYKYVHLFQARTAYLCLSVPLSLSLCLSFSVSLSLSPTRFVSFTPVSVS